MQVDEKVWSFREGIEESMYTREGIEESMFTREGTGEGMEYQGRYVVSGKVWRNKEGIGEGFKYKECHGEGM